LFTSTTSVRFSQVVSVSEMMQNSGDVCSTAVPACRKRRVSFHDLPVPGGVEMRQRSARAYSAAAGSDAAQPEPVTCVLVVPSWHHSSARQFGGFAAAKNIGISRIGDGVAVGVAVPVGVGDRVGVSVWDTVGLAVAVGVAVAVGHERKSGQ
jgi:hypothetical protein